MAGSIDELCTKFGTERSELIELAKLAEQAERYEDMATFMKLVVETHAQKELLSLEERNLFSVAYKNLVSTRRSACRIINALIKKIKSTPDEESPSKLAWAEEYKVKVEKELNDHCEEVLKLIKDHLISYLGNQTESGVSLTESSVFYFKMKGDYHRYLAEVHGTNNEECIKEADEAYGLAVEKAENGEKDCPELKKTHPIRLGLCLNYSVFLYEIKGDIEQACKLAKTTFDQAIDELETLKDDSYKDSTLIMQLLRDNLTLWASGSQEDETPED